MDGPGTVVAHRYWLNRGEPITIGVGVEMAEDEKGRRQREEEEPRREGRPRRIGRPYDTSRELVEEGDRKRKGTNLDLGEERSEEDEAEVRRWREE